MAFESTYLSCAEYAEDGSAWEKYAISSKPFLCSVSTCRRMFAHPCDYTTHMEDFHLDPRYQIGEDSHGDTTASSVSWNCTRPDCEYKTNEKGVFCKHLRTAHRIWYFLSAIKTGSGLSVYPAEILHPNLIPGGVFVREVGYKVLLDSGSNVSVSNPVLISLDVCCVCYLERRACGLSNHSCRYSASGVCPSCVNPATIYSSSSLLPLFLLHPSCTIHHPPSIILYQPQPQPQSCPPAQPHHPLETLTLHGPPSILKIL